MLKSAGITSMGGYIPAKEAPEKTRKELVEYLRKETLLYPEYIEEIEDTGHLPGSIETNYDGWESQPWFESWLKKLPPKKQDDPFQGRKERRRVPLDPVSVRESIHPHPMLSSDAETLAGALAIFNSGSDKNEIDLVLVHSLVPDLHVPMNASLVQYKLGLKNAAAYNIDTCCSSFISMMEIAMTYVRCGMKKKVLIIGSSLDSHIMDKSTYYSPITGDGIIAAIIAEVEDDCGYISSHAKSRGQRHKAIIFKKRCPELLITTSQGHTYEQEFVTFNDRTALKEIALNAPEDMTGVVVETLKKAGLSPTDIDFIVMHQPSAWITKVWCEAIGVPLNKSYETYANYGNLAVGSVAVNLIEAVEKGLIKEKDRVMAASSGVGANHIALLQKISPQLIKNNKL
ncbi:MAG: 3-oxoacyl-ACP synthase III family protein [Candidatus Aminicenantes bacterium]|nr:3-oxoacyl-ACP synthase III family protein [Candidatus Aminicenantes bacterium]